MQDYEKIKEEFNKFVEKGKEYQEPDIKRKGNDQESRDKLAFGRDLHSSRLNMA